MKFFNRKKTTPKPTPANFEVKGDPTVNSACDTATFAAVGWSDTAACAPTPTPILDSRVCNWYGFRIKNLFIRKDYVLFVEIGGVQANWVEQGTNPGILIALETSTYTVYGTYLGFTKCGVLLGNWDIRKGIQE